MDSELRDVAVSAHTSDRPFDRPVVGSWPPDFPLSQWRVSPEHSDADDSYRIRTERSGPLKGVADADISSQFGPDWLQIPWVSV